MKLFGQRLNPFSEFTVNLGPVYIERLFETLLIKEGGADIRHMASSDCLSKFIELLDRDIKKKKRIQKMITEFYLAYFNHKLKNYEKALQHYQHYLMLTTGREQTKYYAQWQVGLLMDSLRYPWEIIQEQLLKARLIDASRGEAVKKITEHYISIENWASAYIFSSYSITHYYNRNPIASRTWYVDFDSYNWKLLDTHIQICRKTEKYKEAESTYHELVNYVLEHLCDFDLQGINYIHEIGNSFYYAEKLSVLELPKNIEATQGIY